MACGDEADDLAVRTRLGHGGYISVFRQGFTALLKSRSLDYACTVHHSGLCNMELLEGYIASSQENRSEAGDVIGDGYRQRKQDDRAVK